MPAILLSEAQKDLEQVLHQVRDSGPVKIVHEGRVVGEIHPPSLEEEPARGRRGEGRTLEEIWKSMDERRERGTIFAPGELDELRRAGRRY